MLPAPPRQRLKALRTTALVLALISLRLVITLFLTHPIEAPLALTGLLIVGPALYWLARPSFFPLSSARLMFLWGAGVAVPLAIVVEGLIGIFASQNTIAVFVAPLVEESLKFAGIIMVVRYANRQNPLRVATLSDALVAAGSVAIGFAVVEDLFYLIGADHSHLLGYTFLLRDVLTPFAHPLFTSFSALGYMLYLRHKQVWFMLAGLVLAAIAHGTFNATATLISSSGLSIFAISLIALIVCLFIAMVVVAIYHRHRLYRINRDYALSLVPVPYRNSLSSTRAIYQLRRHIPRPQRAYLGQVARALTLISLPTTSSSDRASLANSANSMLASLWPTSGSPSQPGYQPSANNSISGYPAPPSYSSAPNPSSPPTSAHIVLNHDVPSPAPAASISPEFPPPAARHPGPISQPSPSQPPGWYSTGPYRYTWFDGNSWSYSVDWNGTSWVRS